MRIPEGILVKILFSGVKFYYKSYDHKKAVEEINRKNGNVTYQMSNMFEGIPNKIKENNVKWRIGKIRMIDIDPEGFIRKMRIGNKRFKTYYPEDFGVHVFPILKRYEDEFELISQNLAVDADNIT